MIGLRSIRAVTAMRSSPDLVLLRDDAHLADGVHGAAGRGSDGAHHVEGQQACVAIPDVSQSSFGLMQKQSRCRTETGRGPEDARHVEGQQTCVAPCVKLRSHSASQ